MHKTEYDTPTEECTVALVEPPDGELERLNAELPDWHLTEAKPDTLAKEGDTDGGQDVAAVVVFARKDEEPHALDVCHKLKRMGAYERTPLLVGITIYQMPLGNDVKRLPASHFIFMPISADDLRRLVADMAEAG